MTRMVAALVFTALMVGCGDDGGPSATPATWPMAVPLCEIRQKEPVVITPCTLGKDEWNVRPGICRDGAGALAYDDCLILLNQDDSTVSTFCTVGCYPVLP